jgi:hypothetical protein
MKTSFLAASILAASSLSQAGLAPIDDTQLGGITGQAGVTIESELRATIGSVVYTDEGSVSINNIVFGGANKLTYFGTNYGAGSHSGNKLDGSEIRIDVKSDGDVKIVGGPAASSGNIVDFRLATGNIDLISADGLTSSTFIDSINLTGFFTAFSARIDAATLHTDIRVTVSIDDLDLDISPLGIKIENAFITDTSFFEELKDSDGVVRDVGVEHLTTEFKLDVYADDEGLHIDPVQVEFDMGIGGIIIADASIGSLALDNVNLSSLSVTISGHP